ncbi:unnamed protein product, partial [Adineta ricciae]
SNIQTHTGESISAKFCIMATGCLSIPKQVDINGINNFKGKTYYTSQWPHENINFHDQRVAVIGTGSSGVQSIPLIAEEAAHLYVFQRTPCFSIPARNTPLDLQEEQIWNKDYNEHRQKILNTYAGFHTPGLSYDQSALSVSPETQQKAYETRGQLGGLS